MDANVVQLQDRVGLTDLAVGREFTARTPAGRRAVYRVSSKVVLGSLYAVNVRTGKERAFTPQQLADSRVY